MTTLHGWLGFWLLIFAVLIAPGLIDKILQFFGI